MQKSIQHEKKVYSQRCYPSMLHDHFIDLPHILEKKKKKKRKENKYKVEKHYIYIHKKRGRSEIERENLRLKYIYRR